MLCCNYIHYRYHELSLNRIKTRHVRLDFSSISTKKMSNKYDKSVLNIMCDPICDVITVFEAAIPVNQRIIHSL